MQSGFHPRSGFLRVVVKQLLKSTKRNPEERGTASSPDMWVRLTAFGRRPSSI